MDIYSVRKYLLPPGVILSLTLVGLILFGALLYSRADRAQRFLEPALAISQPRSMFAIRFSSVVNHELGPHIGHEVLLVGNTLQVRKDKLFPKDFHTSGKAPLLVDISKVFQTVLDDPKMSPYVDLVLVVTRVPQSNDQSQNVKRRHEALKSSEKILNSLFAVNLELERKHSNTFASTALVGDGREASGDIIEFHIIPSERPHIDLLQKLQKYIR